MLTKTFTFTSVETCISETFFFWLISFFFLFFCFFFLFYFFFLFQKKITDCIVGKKISPGRSDGNKHFFSLASVTFLRDDQKQAWDISKLSFHFFSLSLIMKCKVSTSITLIFCDKNMDMHNTRVIHWCIPYSSHYFLNPDALILH